MGLRPYQLEAIRSVEQTLAAGAGRVLLVAPTGAGKTVIACDLIRREVERGGRVLFVAHRRELTSQVQGKLAAVGLDAGVIQAGCPMNLDEPVQVCMVQTFWARAHRSRRLEPPPANLVVVDEAHHVRARTYQKILESYEGAAIVGLTATPCRGDGKGLGNAFSALVQCPQVPDLIEQGFLVKTVVYAPSKPDLKGVRVERGDYVESALAGRMDQPKLIGDIVEHWHRLSGGRRTVVFATGVAHSVHIRDEFRRSGVVAEHIDGKTPVEDRDEILARLSRGEVDVVSNCMVLTEGWDQPDVACIVLARPTKNMGLYRQMIGRVLRPAPGKEHALVLDHAGATWEHGLVEEPVEWSLNEDRRAVSAEHAARGKYGKPELTTCPECKAVRTQGQPCPACGWQPRPKPVAVEVEEGELARFGAGPQVWTYEERASFHRQLAWIARSRGYQPGWAAHKYRERFNEWPPTRHPVPEPPQGATLRWVKSRQIAWAKSRAAERA